MRVKICGITQREQGIAIAHLGATALGFICVPGSPRYVSIGQMKAIIGQLPDEVARIGVFANAPLNVIIEIVSETRLTGVQLHGDETPEFCQHLRASLPHIESIKALRIENEASLALAETYVDCVDTLLLDAYHPHLLGGTGKTLPWDSLSQFNPSIPWLLAGGLTPANVTEALSRLSPNGIDLSSGVERSPGDKDLEKVAQLFEQLNLVNSV